MPKRCTTVSPRRRIGQAGFLFLFLLWPLGLAAQDEVPPLTETFDVRVVNVDVVVTDRKGVPIRGLEASDFELFEDGQPVEISNFFAYAPGSRNDPGNAEGRGTGDAAAPPEATAREPLVLAIYLDENNVPPFARERVLQDLEPVLETWADDNVQFVYVRRANRLLFEAGPTTDPREVIDALSKDLATPRGAEVDREYRRALASIEAEYVACANVRGDACDPCSDTGFEALVALARRYANEQTGRVVDAAASSAHLISVLSGVRGRKAVLYVTEALPQSPGLSMFGMLGQLCPLQLRRGDQLTLEFDETTRLNALASHANANRVALYTLDAGGVRQASGIDATTGRFGNSGSQDGNAGPRGSTLPSFIPGPQVEAARISNLQNSLFQLADETGGEAILNTNRPYDDLIGMKEDLMSTYSLGFIPQHERSGRVHLLEVKLKDGRRAELRYRRSYRDKFEEELLGERLLSKLYLHTKDQTATSNNPLGLSVSVGEARRTSRREDTVPVEVRFPRESITVLPPSGEDVPVARVRLWMTALGSRGHLPMRQELVELQADDPRLTDDFLSLIVDIDLRRERQRLGIGVRDEISGEESLAVFEMDFDDSARGRKRDSKASRATSESPGAP